MAGAERSRTRGRAEREIVRGWREREEGAREGYVLVSIATYKKKAETYRTKTRLVPLLPLQCKRPSRVDLRWLLLSGAGTSLMEPRRR